MTPTAPSTLRALRLLAAAAALLAATTGRAASSPALRSTLDRVAATVNGDVITLRELERAGGSALQEANLRPPGPERDRARAVALRAAFDTLVADRLFSQQVKKLNIQISDAQVDAQIEDVKRQNGFDDATLDRALMAQGLTLDQYRERLRGQLQNFAVMQSQMNVTVSDQELESYYRSHPQEYQGEDELHVRHIFLPLAETASPAEVQRVQAEGQKILQRLKTGEDFAQVARQVSRGPSAESGGDLGWLKRGTIQKTLEDAAFALKDGQISGLVRAGTGVHILRVDERRHGGGRSFAEVKDMIRDRLLDQKAEANRVQWVAQLRRDALIETRIPELKDQP